MHRLTRKTRRLLFISLPVAVVIGLATGLFLQFNIPVKPTKSLVSISLGQRVLAATESQSPDAYVTQTNLDDTITDIQDDPDSPDANWADAIDTGSDVLAHVSFPTPTGNPNTGAGLQVFQAWVKKAGGSSTGTGVIHLYENGVELTTGTPVNITNTSGQMITLSWDATSLSNADGSGVEAYVFGANSVGKPSNRAVMSVGAVEWNVDYSAGTPDITVSPTSYDFGVVATSSTPSSATNYFTVTNSSSIQTDQTISVTTSTWSGGVTWTHSDTATPGVDTAGMKANRGGTWGVGDVIVKNASPNYIYENCPATTNYDFGLKLWAPTNHSDGVEKQIIVRVTAVAG